MAIRITCPACDAVNSVSDDRRGETIECKNCDKPLSVPDDEQAVQESPRVKVRTGANSRNEASDEEDDRRPTTRRAKQAKEGASMALLAVGGAVAALLLCILGVIGGGGAIFFLRSKAAVEDQAKQQANVEANPQEKPQPVNIKLTDEHIKFVWGKDGDRHVLAFNHVQPHDLKNVNITIHWFYAGYKSNASQGLNWGVWRANDTKQQVMAIVGRPTAIRIIGQADGPLGTKYEIDCPISDPQQDKAQPVAIKLTNAHLKSTWKKEGDRHVLAFNHGQPFDLKNVQVTIHWFQAGYKSNASQKLNWAVWRVNESKQQNMAIRELPTAIRIVGRAEGPNGTPYEIDCPIPDPQ